MSIRPERLALIAFMFLFLSLAVAIPCLAQSTQPVADNHMHIRSEAGTEALVKIMKQVQQQEGVTISDSAGAERIIGLLDSSGTEKAALLSTAYFFGMPEMDFEDERSLVRRENKYVGRQAAKHPERLTAFCGINPLSDYAADEVGECAQHDAVSGIKLHLANSGVDLRDEEHRSTLAGVFEEANRHSLAIVIHLWTRNSDYGKKDVQLFIDEVLPQAPDVPVQVAHMGGPGSYSEVTGRASAAFADAIAGGNPHMENVWFDLSAVPHNPDRAEDEQQRKQLREMNRQLEQRIRELGTDRVLWGTDWIAGPTDRYTGPLGLLSRSPPKLWRRLLPTPLLTWSSMSVHGRFVPSQ